MSNDRSFFSSWKWPFQISFLKKDQQVYYRHILSPPGKTWFCWIAICCCIVGLLVFADHASAHVDVQPAGAQYGRGGASAPSWRADSPLLTQKVCGHPTEVFQQLGFSIRYVPSEKVLQALPTPQQHPVTKAGDLSYDPAPDQLCTISWQGIYIRYVQPFSTDASAPSAPPSSEPVPSGSGSSGWVQDILHGLFMSSAQGLSDFLNGVLSWAKTFGFMFITPDGLTYNHPVIRNLNTWMVGVMGSLVMLALVVGGYNTLLGSQQVLRELAPRLLCAGIAGTFSLFFLTQFIEVQNALDLSLLKALASAGVGNLSLPLGAINWVIAPEYEIVTYLIDLVMSVLLCMQMLVRIGLLDFLIVLAPLGLFCFALPQTLAWGRLWVQAFVSTLLLQFFQTVCIGLGSTLVASFGHASYSVVTILVGIATLYIASKLPGMLLSNVLRASVGEVNRDAGRAVRTVMELVALKGA